MEISASLRSGSSNAASATAAPHQNKSHADKLPGDNEDRREHGVRRHHHQHRALNAFRQELRASLKVAFQARFAVHQQGYAGAQDIAAPDDVAQDALQAAKRLTAESPRTAAKSLISFKAKVHETASYVRETVGDDDLSEVDDAVARVDAGIARLEDEVANSRESSASVLEVDTRTKQRSTIRIRTQEGDVVKLSLRRTDSLSATDKAQSDGESTSTSTEVSVSSRSRMMLKVDGDLNESELAAIQNVFAQAEQIANDFFGGDLQAAFASAQGFEFDAEQLAHVNMKFRMQQHTAVSYRETTGTPLIEANPEPTAIAGDPVTPAATPAAAAKPEVAASEPALVETTTPAPVAAESVEEPSPLTSNGFSSFLESVSNFLRAVGEGFSDQSGSSSIRLHYSESFKLEFLKTVFHTVAPEQAQDAAASAESVIDQLLEVASE